MFCKKCGYYETDSDAAFCPKCGRSYNAPAPDNSAEPEPVSAGNKAQESAMKKSPGDINNYSPAKKPSAPLSVNIIAYIVLTVMGFYAGSRDNTFLCCLCFCVLAVMLSFAYFNKSDEADKAAAKPETETKKEVSIMPEFNKNVKKVKKWEYVAFALFVGSLGIHKFYAGRTAAGFIYLAITIFVGVVTGGAGVAITCLMAFIDGVIAMFKSADDAGMIEL